MNILKILYTKLGQNNSGKTEAMTSSTVTHLHIILYRLFKKSFVGKKKNENLISSLFFILFTWNFHCSVHLKKTFCKVSIENSHLTHVGAQSVYSGRARMNVVCLGCFMERYLIIWISETYAVSARHRRRAPPRLRPDRLCENPATCSCSTIQY